VGQVFGPVAAALFADKPASLAADLPKVAGSQTLSQVATTDVVVLLAVASRRAGGEAWRTFRADGADLLGNLPLPGAVVVLVTNLATADLPILAGTR